MVSWAGSFFYLYCCDTCVIVVVGGCSAGVVVVVAVVVLGNTSGACTVPFISMLFVGQNHEKLAGGFRPLICSPVFGMIDQYSMAAITSKQ